MRNSPLPFLTAVLWGFPSSQILSQTSRVQAKTEFLRSPKSELTSLLQKLENGGGTGSPLWSKIPPDAKVRPTVWRGESSGTPPAVVVVMMLLTSVTSGVVDEAAAAATLGLADVQDLFFFWAPASLITT